MSSNASAAATILERLVAAIGMDPAALEPARLRWIVAARCRKLGLANDVAYAGYLAATAAELDELIDEVVVLETRFFRDPAVSSMSGRRLRRLRQRWPGRCGSCLRRAGRGRRRTR